MDFSRFNLCVSEENIQKYFKESGFSPLKRAEPDLWKKLSVTNNVLCTTAQTDSYLAADLAEFLRQSLLAVGMSFTYETVMSHVNKIKFMAQARLEGYRVYLYYIATEDPDINVSRVDIRIIEKGHGVSKEAIVKRYFKSLQQLKKAVQNSDRAYIWDNSGEDSLLFAEIESGIDVQISVDSKLLPAWFIKYLVENTQENE